MSTLYRFLSASALSASLLSLPSLAAAQEPGGAVPPPPAVRREGAREVRRGERRKRTESSAAAEFVLTEAGPEDGVLEASAQDWRKRRLAAGMAQLPPEQRAALELAYYDGLTYTQVAKALGIPEGTAKSRLRLAMGRLRVVLGDEMRSAI